MAAPERPQLDHPLIARIREAARSALLTAAEMRRENPARRASSQHAHVDLWPDGRLIALVVDDEQLSGQRLVRHFTELYQAALQRGADQSGSTESDAEITVEPLPDLVDRTPALSDVATELDPTEDAGIAIARAERALAAKAAAVRTVLDRGVTPQAVVSTPMMQIELAGPGYLAALHLDPRTGAMPLDQVNAELAELVEQAHTELTEQRRRMLQEARP